MAGKEKLGTHKAYFLNLIHCNIIESSQTHLVPNLPQITRRLPQSKWRFFTLLRPFRVILLWSDLFPEKETLFVSTSFFEECFFLIDNGAGKNLQIFYMSTTGLSVKERKALAGMHAFLGSNYVSSFFWKGKFISEKK